MLPLLLLMPAFALRLWLLLRQRRVLRSDASAGYARAVVTQRVGQQLWQSLWALLVLLMLSRIAAVEAQFGSGVTLIVLVLAGWLWELPARVWKVFVTDAAYRFNRLTVPRFVREQAGRALLFALLAVPAALAAVMLFKLSGGLWWLLLWLAGWAGHSALRWLQPRYLTPLFDVVEPLPESPLRRRLEASLRRCGVTRQRLFVLRSSARSAQANAQVSGRLGAPRIVLTDTLIERLPPDEVEAVVTHELGHLQRGHLRFQMLMLGALWLLLVAVIALLTQRIPAIAPRLAIAWAMVPSAWFFALPVVNAVYRRFEFEADEAAAQNSSAAAMAAALRRLTQNNANALHSDPWYQRVYHTHPDLGARLARLDRVAS